MPQIITHDLVKTFRVAEREPGRAGAELDSGRDAGVHWTTGDKQMPLRITMETQLQEETIQIAENIRSLKPYHPGHPIEEVQRQYGLTSIIKLASNENALGPSPRAVKAMQAACTRVGLYPDGACFDLKQALSRHLDVSPEMIAIGNGSDELIQYLGLAFLQPGDEVIQAEPTFVRYEAAATLGKARLIRVPLRNYTHDLDAMAEAFSERTRLVFIANPNNPTGTMNTNREVGRFLERMPSRAILVLDEAYREYVEDPDYPDAVSLIRSGANVIALRTFSKIYGLAGLRIGYGIARPQIISFLNQVREPFNVNLIAQAGALASLEDPDQVQRSRDMNRAGMKFLTAEFKDMGLCDIPSVANFIMVDVNRPSERVAQALESRGVIIRPGANLGLPTFIRVTIGTAEECHRFAETLREVLSQS